MIRPNAAPRTRGWFASSLFLAGRIGAAGIMAALWSGLATAQGISPIHTDDPSAAEQAGAYSTTGLVLPGQWGIDGVVNAIARSGNTIYLGGEFSITSTHAGAGVPLDRSTGEVITTFPVVSGINTIVYAAVEDGAGGWYIGGEFSSVGGLPRNRLAHILVDGTVAPWNPGADGWVYALAREGNAVYVGGHFHRVGGQLRTYLAAVDGATGAVLPWNPAASGVVGALAISGETLYVGGGFSSILGQPRSCIAAVDSRSGALTAWNPGAGSYVACLAVHGDIVYAGGNFQTMGGLRRSFLAAVDARTGATTSWNPDVAPPPWDPFFGSDIVSTIAVTDAAVYLGGYFSGVGGEIRRSIAAVDPSTGSPLPWRVPLPQNYFHPVVFAIQISGSNAFVGGMFASPNARSNILVADAASGAVREWNLFTDLGVTLIAPSQNRVYVGGAFRTFRSTRRCLASINAVTGVLNGWNSGFRGTRVNTLAVGDTSLFVGGLFSGVAGRGGSNLAVIDTRADTAVNFRGGSDREVRALLKHGSRLYVGGSFSNLWGWQLISPTPTRNGIGAFDLDAGPRAVLSPWDPEADGEVDALAAHGSTLYVGGRFGEIGGQFRPFIASLDVSTGEATEWNPSADGPVSALAASGGVVFAGGGFSTVGGEPRRGLAALDSRTGFATDWNADVDGAVRALEEKGDILYVGGAFQNVGVQARSRMAALRASTGLVLPWDPGANGEVRALMARGSAVFAGGAFTSVDGVERKGLAAIAAATIRERSSPGYASHSRTLAPSLACAPSPVRSAATIDFTIPAPALVTLAFYDLAGRRVASPLDRQFIPAGTRQVLVPTETWPAGCYFCRLTVGPACVNQRIVVVR